MRSNVMMIIFRRRHQKVGEKKEYCTVYSTLCSGQTQNNHTYIHTTANILKGKEIMSMHMQAV